MRSGLTAVMKARQRLLLTRIGNPDSSEHQQHRLMVRTIRLARGITSAVAAASDHSRRRRIMACYGARLDRHSVVSTRLGQCSLIASRDSAHH